MESSLLQKMKNYAGIGVDMSPEVQLRLCRSNANTASICMALSTLMFGVLFLYAQVASSWHQYSYVYAFAAICSLVLYLCVHNLVLKNDYQKASALGYVCLSLLLGVGIFNGSLVTQGSITVVFPVFLIALPILFTDKPWRTAMVILAAVVVFCFVDLSFKDQGYSSVDCVHAVVFGIVGIVLGAYVSNMKSNSAELNERIKKMGLTDALTGLPNRYACDEDMKLLEDSPDNCDVACVSIDVNGLKFVNDTKGHVGGDELLCGVAQCLVHSFGIEGSVYRVGGDEFIAITRGDSQTIEALVDDFKTRCFEWHSDLVTGISCSIGWAFVNEATSAAVLQAMRLADKRMFEDKARYYSLAKNDRRKR